MEAFSDGVFAIAITLLVLDIDVPSSELADLWKGIADQWPAYLAFLTSFLAIGAVWLQHHGLFSCLRLVDTTIMRLNLALLLAVCFLPFPTRLMAEALTTSRADERAAVVLYGATLLAVGLLLSALWRRAAANDALVYDDVRGSVIAEAERRQLPFAGLYAAALVVAVVIVPRAAAFAYLAIALISVGSAREWRLGRTAHRGG